MQQCNKTPGRKWLQPEPLGELTTIPPNSVVGLGEYALCIPFPLSAFGASDWCYWSLFLIFKTRHVWYCFSPNVSVSAQKVSCTSMGQSQEHYHGRYTNSLALNSCRTQLNFNSQQNGDYPTSSVRRRQCYYQNYQNSTFDLWVCLSTCNISIGQNDIKFWERCATRYVAEQQSIWSASALWNADPVYVAMLSIIHRAPLIRQAVCSLHGECCRAQ